MTPPKEPVANPATKGTKMSEKNLVDLSDEPVQYPEEVTKFRAMRETYCREASVTPRECYRRIKEAALADTGTDARWTAHEFDASSTWVEKIGYLRQVATSEGISLPE